MLNFNGTWLPKLGYSPTTSTARPPSRSYTSRNNIELALARMIPNALRSDHHENLAQP
jgi:hypothetical protein